jgi:hypothetical protein
MDAVAKRDHDRHRSSRDLLLWSDFDEFGKVKPSERISPRPNATQKLAESLPKYLAEIERCIKVPMPDKTMAAFLDASYNAGSAAVCRSPYGQAGQCRRPARCLQRLRGLVCADRTARFGADSSRGAAVTAARAKSSSASKVLPTAPAPFRMPQRPPVAPTKRPWWRRVVDFQSMIAAYARVPAESSMGALRGRRGAHWARRRPGRFGPADDLVMMMQLRLAFPVRMGRRRHADRLRMPWPLRCSSRRNARGTHSRTLRKWADVPLRSLRSPSWGQSLMATRHGSDDSSRPMGRGVGSRNRPRRKGSRCC